jgi:hypothetical protein
VVCSSNLIFAFLPTALTIVTLSQTRINLISIAGEMAYHGHRVKMYDSNVNMLDSAHGRIEEDKRQLQKDGLLPHPNFVVGL